MGSINKSLTGVLYFKLPVLPGCYWTCKCNCGLGSMWRVGIKTPKSTFLTNRTFNIQTLTKKCQFASWILSRWCCRRINILSVQYLLLTSGSNTSLWICLCNIQKCKNSSPARSSNIHLALKCLKVNSCRPSKHPPSRKSQRSKYLPLTFFLKVDWKEISDTSSAPRSHEAAGGSEVSNRWLFFCLSYVPRCLHDIEEESRSVQEKRSTHQFCQIFAGVTAHSAN